MAKGKYDLHKVAQTTKHYVGCSCCWCDLAKSGQDWKRTADTFRETYESNPIVQIAKLLGLK